MHGKTNSIVGSTGGKKIDMLFIILNVFFYIVVYMFLYMAFYVFFHIYIYI